MSTTSSETSSVNNNGDETVPSNDSSEFATNHHHQQQQQQHGHGHAVKLAIYDLSRGMARSLSAQLLLAPEHALDCIPHTGVLVFGKEYFFGSGTGVTKEDPDHFRTTRNNLQPLEILTVGTTKVSQHDFEQWCQDMSQTQFHASKYHLFDNNCNQFSHCALQQGLRMVGASVPRWILEVPRKFLASPLGPLARPFLENIQVAGGVPFTTTTTTDNTQETTTDPTTTTESSDSDNIAAELDGEKKDCSTVTDKGNPKKLHPREPTDTDGGNVASPPKSKVPKTSHHHDDQEITAGTINSSTIQASLQ